MSNISRVAPRTSRSPKSPEIPTKTARVSPPKSEKIAIVRPKSVPKTAPKLPSNAQLSLETDVISPTSAANSPKAKRPRVPTDFAQSYGENRKERKEIVAIAPVEKKRRKTAQERENLRQLMTPDDDIVQRLARAAPSVPSRASRQKVVKLRKNEWESRCGKCGNVEVFGTPASLCSRCGAIAVRVLD